MAKKTIYKTVSLNDGIVKAITLYQAENQCADFSEALRLIISSHFKNIDIQEEEKKTSEDIAKIKEILDAMRRVLINLSDKK